MSNIPTLKAMVEKVLTDMPVTRNSDIALTIEIWKRYYPNKLIMSNDRLYVDTASLFELPREDNVKRIRAQFNADGKYYPTVLEIVKKRSLNEQIWRAELGYRETSKTLWPTKQLSYTERLKKYD